MPLVIELPKDLEAKLQAAATQQGISVSELALGALEQLVKPRQKPIEEMTAAEYLLHLAALHSDAMPEEERDALPPDYAKNYKHYLYSSPKEEE